MTAQDVPRMEYELEALSTMEAPVRSTVDAMHYEPCRGNLLLVVRYVHPSLDNYPELRRVVLTRLAGMRPDSRAAEAVDIGPCDHVSAVQIVSTLTAIVVSYRSQHDYQNAQWTLASFAIDDLTPLCEPIVCRQGSVRDVRMLALRDAQGALSHCVLWYGLQWGGPHAAQTRRKVDIIDGRTLKILQSFLRYRESGQLVAQCGQRTLLFTSADARATSVSLYSYNMPLASEDGDAAALTVEDCAEPPIRLEHAPEPIRHTDVVNDTKTIGIWLPLGDSQATCHANGCATVESTKSGHIEVAVRVLAPSGAQSGCARWLVPPLKGYEWQGPKRGTVCMTYSHADGVLYVGYTTCKHDYFPRLNNPPFSYIARIPFSRVRWSLAVAYCLVPRAFRDVAWALASVWCRARGESEHNAAGAVIKPENATPSDVADESPWQSWSGLPLELFDLIVAAAWGHYACEHYPPDFGAFHYTGAQRENGSAVGDKTQAANRN